MTAPEAPFDEPWQAQLFALTVALNEAGHVSWPDWAARFGPRVQTAAASAYWQVWSETLVGLLEELQIAETEDIRRLARQWQAAAAATPHGQPIALANAAAHPPSQF